MSKRLFEKRPITWLPCKLLKVVWRDAQRPYDDDRAQKIADDFDPDKFGVIHVAKVNGKGVYHVYEGQHRVAALQKKYGPEEHAPCTIGDDIDEERAAELFLGINAADSRKPPSQLETFHVAVTANRPVPVAVNDLVEKLGYRVSGGDKNGKGIAACQTLCSIYNRYGPDILEATLVTLRTTWGWDQTAVQATILAGFAAFLREFGHKIEPKKLTSKMEKKFTPGRLLASAKAMKEAGLSNSGTAAIVEILMTTYNTGMRSDGILKRKST